MRIFSLALSCILLALVGCSEISTPSIRNQSMTVVRLELNNHDICSGTVVAPSVILTAAHCFETKKSIPPSFMEINGRKTKIISILSDDNDHVLVEVDYKFNYISFISNIPSQGAHIHYWGNPGGIIMAYREGYVSTFIHSMMMLNINGFFGDSGSGVFDDAGNIVGVINIISVKDYKGLTFSLMGCAPLEFTTQQYEMMGVIRI